MCQGQDGFVVPRARSYKADLLPTESVEEDTGQKWGAGEDSEPSSHTLTAVWMAKHGFRACNQHQYNPWAEKSSTSRALESQTLKEGVSPYQSDQPSAPQGLCLCKQPSYKEGHFNLKLCLFGKVLIYGEATQCVCKDNRRGHCWFAVLSRISVWKAHLIYLLHNRI